MSLMLLLHYSCQQYLPSPKCLNSISAHCVTQSPKTGISLPSMPSGAWAREESSHADIQYVVGSGAVVEHYPDHKPDPKAWFMTEVEGSRATFLAL
jgi:hypothetical protein